MASAMKERVKGRAWIRIHLPCGRLPLCQGIGDISP